MKKVKNNIVGKVIVSFSFLYHHLKIVSVGYFHGMHTNYLMREKLLSPLVSRKTSNVRVTNRYISVAIAQTLTVDNNAILLSFKSIAIAIACYMLTVTFTFYVLRFNILHFTFTLILCERIHFFSFLGYKSFHDDVFKTSFAIRT